MNALQIGVVSGYGLAALGTLATLWRNRFTPFDRRLREFHVPKVDDEPLVLHSSSDVGVV